MSKNEPTAPDFTSKVNGTITSVSFYREQPDSQTGRTSRWVVRYTTPKGRRLSKSFWVEEEGAS